MSENLSHGCVVVGLNEHGQPGGSLLAAADEAQERGLELAVVTVLRPNFDPGLNIIGLRREELLAQATALQGLHRAAAAVHTDFPGLQVITYCLVEDELGSCRDPLSRAELLVLGAHDRYGRQALVLGSASRLMLTSSRCPVLVVPDQPRRHGFGQPPLILVGVSQHPADVAVVQAAYSAAAYRGGNVLLIHAYSARRGESSDQARRRAQSVLTGFITQAPTGIQVSVAVVEDKPATALLSLAADATLLVIGGRTGALSGLIRESVSHTVLQTAPCPVLAVPRHLAETPTRATFQTLDPVHQPHPIPQPDTDPAMDQDGLICSKPERAVR